MIFIIILISTPMQITVVPDTNVLMNNLNLIKEFIKNDSCYSKKILILEIVLKELDFQKKSSKAARDAIKYFQENSKNRIVKIEGRINFDEMDVVNEEKKYSKDSDTNDLKIIEDVAKLYHGVLITEDRNMFLLANSKNVRCIHVTEDSDFLSINLEVMLLQTNVEKMEVCGEEITSIRCTIQEEVRRKILPRVKFILKDELGKGYDILYKDRLDELNLKDLVKLIVKEFDMFRNYIPRSSRTFLMEVESNLKDNNEDKINDYLLNLLILFRIPNDA